MKFGIVCGYGSELDDNLKRYIDFVYKQIEQYNLDVIVLTGGYSYRNSTSTEAELMYKLLSEKYFNTEFLLENKAITTLHNLLYSEKLIKASHIEIDKIYIFCDSIRLVKVMILSKIIFSKFSTKVVSIEREESVLIYLLQLPSIVTQVLGAIFPVIEKKIWQSKQNWIDKYR